MVKASDYVQVRYLKDVKSIYIRHVRTKVLSCQIETYLKSCHHEIESWLVYLQEALLGHPDLIKMIYCYKTLHL